MKTGFYKIFALAMMIVMAVSLVWHPGRAVPVRTGDTLYVKPGTGGGCTSFPDACELQTALTQAATGDQIWVTTGTYTPTTGDDRAISFNLKSGVEVYGGFPAAGGAWETRDWEANPTILSGDIGVHDDNSDNSYHVVTAFYVDDSALLDGFEISGGNANGADLHESGGGILAQYSNLTLMRLIITNNEATYGGGGMENMFDGNPTLSGITFEGNTADRGAGLYSGASDINISSSLFIDNHAASSGGGMYQTQGSYTLVDVNFYQNTATAYHGGGIFNLLTSGSTMENVKFTENSAGDNGGGLYSDTVDNLFLSGISFYGNSAFNGGGMVNLESTSLTLTNMTFIGNTAEDRGGGIYNANSSSPSISSTTLFFNSADKGGGIFNFDNSNPTFENITLSENSSNLSGGGIYNSTSSNPSLVNVTFSDNSAGDDGGGIYNAVNSSPTLRNAIMWGNTPDSLNSDSTGSTTATYSDIAGGAVYSGTGNINVDPMLDPLSHYGGLTMTHALQEGSPAIDTGSPTICPAIDQRGLPRPEDGNGDGTARCDMGAYEVQSPGKIHYVKTIPSGLQNCSGWTDACTLRDALKIALAGDQVWVGAGVYKPSITNNRGDSFVMMSGVAMYGGFPIEGGPWAARDWEANPTILSGDIGTTGVNNDNSYHVITCYQVDDTAILDGFTITAGNASTFPNVYGGGMVNNECNLRMTDIIISENFAGFLGGGMNNAYSNLSLTRVIFSNNEAGKNGGGMANDHSSSPRLVDVAFNDNSATIGGGMFNDKQSNPILTGVHFSGNSADYGGGMFSNLSSPLVTNVTFSRNTAFEDGAGMFNNDSNPLLTNVTFFENSADESGGAIFNDNGSNPELINAILWGNTPDQITDVETSNTTATYSSIQGGSEFPGMGNINLNPLLVAELLSYNDSFTLMHALQEGSPAIDAGSPEICPATDQRGVYRPIDGDGDGERRCDIGAFEFGSGVIFIYLPIIRR